MKFSVLMSVYSKDSALHLQEALDSVLSQTLLPDEVVLVEDGVLTDELEKLIIEYEDKYPLLKVVRLEKNEGLANALAVGLMQTSHDIVARMDADDICKPQRFEKQIAFLKEHLEVDILGTWIDEFVGDIGNVVSQRKVPQSHDEISQYMRKRCAINHPTVMFKKSVVIDAGNYDKELRLRQDYHLWIRVLAKKYQFANLQESLLFFRTSPDLYKRRGGMKIIRYDYLMQKQLLDHKLINYPRFVMNMLIYGSARLVPSFVRGGIYHLLRKN